MQPPFAAPHFDAAVRTLFRQWKLRERCPRPRFIQGKKVDRSRILAARGGGQGNEHAGQTTTCDRHPGEGAVPLADPCEEKIRAAGFHCDVALAVAWKHCLGGPELVMTCRTIGIN